MSEDLTLAIVFVAVFAILCIFTYSGYRHGYHDGIKFAEELNQKYSECDSVGITRKKCDELIGLKNE